MKKIAFTFLVSLVTTYLFISSAHADTIIISGSTTVKKFIEEAATLYHAQHPDTHIIINADTSGFSDFKDGRAHIGMMSRALSDQEKLELTHTQVIPIAYDAIAPVCPKELLHHSSISSISIEDLKKIYQGEITNWHDIGGPNKKILLIDKNFTHGTRHVFARYILGSPTAPSAAHVVLEDNKDIFNLISNSDQALGYLSLAYQGKNIHFLNLKINHRVIQSSPENVYKGTYPLSRKLYLLVAENAQPEIKQFIRFILSPKAQALAKKSGYLPIQHQQN